MNPIQIIATLRKFGNYLAGLFPVLVTLVDWIKKQARSVVEHPTVAPLWDRVSKSTIGQAIWKVVERFYWRDYAKDRLDLNESPPDTLPVLRPIFQMCACLCILIPFTQYELCPVKIEAFSGFTGTAPGWSVILWMFALPCAWAALLVGSAISNRIVFIASAWAAVYFVSTCVLTLPRSYFNGLLALSVFLSLAFCERTLKNTGSASGSPAYSRAAGFITVLLVGVAAGIQFIILTPIKPWLNEVLQSKDPSIGIISGAIVGVILGTLCFAWGRLPVNEERPYFFRGGSINCGQAVWITALFLFVFTLAGAMRGGLEQSGSLMISSLNVSNSYLWPIWYFIGIGLFHKLLGSSKVIAQAVEMAVPAKVLSPLMVLSLIAALVVCISEKLCVFLTRCSGQWVEPALLATYPIYKATQPLIWSNPTNAMSTHWLTWVLVFDLAVIVMLALRRKLTADAIVRLFFMTCLAYFLIWEYAFQLSSFSRTPTHSVLILFLFSVWLLWLMHTVGWSLSCSSSRFWPATGRLAIYGGVVSLAILEIHARAASEDFKLMNELYLTMFRGIVDVGLPYYFLVWASKRLSKIPASVGMMLGMFSLGGLVSLIFNIFEKFCAGGFSYGGLMTLVNMQLASMKTAGSINLEIPVPHIWFLIRALAYVAAMALIYLFVRRKKDGTVDGARTSVFLFMAFSSGIASFSKTLVELPVPAEIRALTAPLWQETTFNCNVLQGFLAFWIPALMLALSQFGKKNRTVAFLLAALLGVGANYAISMAYSLYEPFLRATGMMYPLILMVTGVFVVLVALAAHYLEQQSDVAESEPAPKTKAELFSMRSLVTLVLFAEFALAIIAFTQNDLVLEQRKVASFEHPVVVATNWEDVPAIPTEPSDAAKSGSVEPAKAAVAPAKPITTLRRKLPDGGYALFQMGTVPSDPAGTTELLKKLMSKALTSGAYPNLAIQQVKSWSEYYPGALACFFSYDMPVGKSSTPISGLSVLVPRSATETEFYTLYTSPSEIEDQQWELTIAVENLKH